VLSITCYQKCGYTLTCDCSVDAGGSTITVSGRVCFEDPVSGCNPRSGEAVEIYHAYWSTTYVVYTDSQGYFRKSGLPRPPAGSTPIYVRWTDPNGVEHECTTSACFGSSSDSGECTSDADCPQGYVCVNGTCQPESYYIDNVQWSLDNFCTSGFTVSSTLRDSSGAKATGRVRIEVNDKQLGEINVNGDFTVGFNRSQYADVPGCSNTIALTAISPSGVVASSVSTTKDCPCNCSYSVSCTVSTTQVNDGGSVTFSGQLSSTSCGVANQQVKIYDNGSLVATATTDSQGRWSATLTLSGAGTHTLKAEAPDGSTCTESVTVLQQTKTANIHLKWAKTGVPFLEAISIDAFVDGVEVFSYTTPVGDPIEYLVNPDKELSAAARFWFVNRYSMPWSETETARDVIYWRLVNELGFNPKTDTARMATIVDGIQERCKRRLQPLVRCAKQCWRHRD